jgi:hypothetical protein
MSRGFALVDALERRFARASIARARSVVVARMARGARALMCGARADLAFVIWRNRTRDDERRAASIERALHRR